MKKDIIFKQSNYQTVEPVNSQIDMVLAAKA